MSPSSPEDDWSDSDSEAASDVETTVLLGVPDGRIEAAPDLGDVAVSRIGGQPALLSSEVPFESSRCEQCSHPMELLVQLWCPLEKSPYDRALYVWGCAKSNCQRREGCIRAWRGLRFNEEYAEKLKKSRAPGPNADHKLSIEPKMQESMKTNPFSIASQTTTSASPFNAASNIGSQLFGVLPASSEKATAKTTDESNADEGSDAESTSTAESIVVALASATLSDSSWSTAPAYPPLYLSTISEYLRPDKRSKKSSIADVTEGAEHGGAWSSEKYENSLEIDQVFDRFNRRVSAEAEQCVRYDLGGTPLAFASDGTYDRLFPKPGENRGATTTIVTKSAFASGPVGSGQRFYDDSSIPTCSHCGGKRVFECQLMPNLINIVAEKPTESADEDKRPPDEERRKAIEHMLKGNGTDGRGMEWGTAFIFSCAKDCCSGKYGWREEYVLVQWDT